MAKYNFASTEARMRELNATLQQENVENREALEAEFANLKREYEMEAAMAKAEREQPKQEGKTICQMIREAAKGDKTFVISTEKREGEVTTALASGGKAIETSKQDILDPLYANSVLAKAGAKFYTGLPMGNISVPVLNKGNVLWKGEVAPATAAGETFGAVDLVPNRLTGYIDISNMLIAQDTKQAEEAIKRDLVNCIQEKLEATILGNAAANNSPAGIFNGKDLEDGTTFAGVCEIEATVEAANVSNIKYIVSPAAKADFRKMPYGGKSTSNVWSANEVDGTPALVTSNVAAGTYVVGDFSNLAIGLWGNIEVKVDDLSQAINGCTRLVVTLYADAKKLREVAFAYGRTRAIG